MKTKYSILLALAFLISSVNLIAQNFALDFDGLNDKVGILDSPELNPQNELTIEAWINAEEWQSSIWAGVIISKQGTSPDKGYCLSAGENGRVEFTVSINEAWSSVNTPQLLGTNAWYHIAGVYDGSQMKMYINGELQSTEDVVGEPTAGTGVVVNIGDNPTWPGRFWNGKLDEIRVWSVARTVTEIQANMSIELTGTEVGLVAYYPMNEGAGTITADVSGNDNGGQLINMDNSAWVDGFEPVTADVGVIGIASPSVIGNGFTASEKVKIEIKNFATQPVSNFEVSYKIGNGDLVTETITIDIEPFDTYIHTFQDLVNLSGITEIDITGYTNLDGDSNPANDELSETIEPTLNYMVFDQKRHNYGGYGQSHTKPVYMPEDLGDYSEIYLNVNLECPTGGCDPWDQPAKIYINKGDESYELARYITPYGVACGGWTWDISDFRSLLIDKVDWISYVQVWGASGWLVSIEIELIEGTPEYPYVIVDKLWAEDNHVYGDPLIPYDFPEIPIYVWSETDASKIRMTMTGHGQGNTNNAAEFSNFTHHIHIDGQESFTQNLWKDDCDQNSCSPQSGTWPHSRAGWCPGQDVQPWEWDMNGLYTPGGFVDVDFVLQDYTNLNNTGYNGGSHTEPHYRCHAYFIQYSTDEFVGIDDNSQTENDIIGYPNPTTGMFTIKASINDKLENVAVFQLNGKLVTSVNGNGQKDIRLNLGDYPSGIYFIKVQSSLRSTVIKTIVKE